MLGGAKVNLLVCRGVEIRIPQKGSRLHTVFLRKDWLLLGDNYMIAVT